MGRDHSLVLLPGSVLLDSTICINHKDLRKIKMLFQIESLNENDHRLSLRSSCPRCRRLRGSRPLANSSAAENVERSWENDDGAQE